MHIVVSGLGLVWIAGVFVTGACAGLLLAWYLVPCPWRVTRITTTQCARYCATLIPLKRRA